MADGMVSAPDSRVWPTIAYLARLANDHLRSCGSRVGKVVGYLTRSPASKNLAEIARTQGGGRNGKLICSHLRVSPDSVGEARSRNSGICGYSEHQCRRRAS